MLNINNCDQPYMTMSQAIVTVSFFVLVGITCGYLLSYGDPNSGAVFINKCLRKIYRKYIKNDFIMGIISFNILYVILFICFKMVGLKFGWNY